MEGPRYEIENRPTFPKPLNPKPKAPKPLNPKPWFANFSAKAKTRSHTMTATVTSKRRVSLCESQSQSVAFVGFSPFEVWLYLWALFGADGVWGSARAFDLNVMSWNGHVEERSLAFGGKLFLGRISSRPVGAKEPPSCCHFLFL